MATLSSLDRIDRQILRVLQKDAQITNLDLSARVNLSPAACLRRVEKLRAEGVIRKTVALLEPAAADMATLVIVGVVLDRPRRGLHRLRRGRARHQRLPGVSSGGGEFDYFLMLRIRDLERFNKLHAGEIIKLPGVRQIRTFFVLKEIMSTTELPL